MPPTDPTTTTGQAPVSPASTNTAPATPGSATIPPSNTLPSPTGTTPAPAPLTAANAAPAAPAISPADPTPLAGAGTNASTAAPAEPAKEEKPVEVFILLLDTGEPLDPATVAKAIALAKEAGVKPVHYAYVAHDTMAAYGRLMALSADGKTASVAPVDAIQQRRAFPMDELFDPKTAETAYLNLVAAAKKAAADLEAAKIAAAAPAAGGTAPVAAKVALMLALLIPALFGLSGCGATAGVAQQPSSAQTTAAKIGTIVKAIETPTMVQGEAQLLTAEILQRAVAENKQPVVAGWCTCISRGLEDLAGTANPSAADLQAAIRLEAGPQSDPEFDVLIATAVDMWGTVKAAIPPGSTSAQVETYLNAAATGVQNAAVGYLPATAKIMAWITLEHARKRALRRVHRAERHQAQ